MRNKSTPTATKNLGGKHILGEGGKPHLSESGGLPETGKGSPVERQPREMQSGRDFFFLCTYRRGLPGHSAQHLFSRKKNLPSHTHTHTHTHTDVRHTNFTPVTFQKASLQHT